MRFPRRDRRSTPTDLPADAGWARSAVVERRLQALQALLFVVLAAIVVLTAVWAGRSMVQELHASQADQARAEGITEVRLALRAEETALWQRRARGDSRIPVASTRVVLAAAQRTNDLARAEIAAHPRGSAERRGAADTAAGLRELVGIATTRGEAAPVGSPADRRHMARLVPAVTRLKAAADRWSAADSAGRHAANARLRATVQRSIVASGAVALIAVLIGFTGWMLVSRARRRMVAALRDATVRLGHLAQTDPLTGLGNHRLVHDRLREAVPEALAAGRPLSLLMLDLDHFKRVNDTHGHPAGDAVLAETARRMTACVRPGDVLARVGGEEFLLVLPGTDAPEALVIAERVRAAVSATPFGAAIGSLTVSIGVASLEEGLDADGLVSRADGALYWAKAHGRDAAHPYSAEVIRDVSPAGGALPVEPGRDLVALRALARAIDAKDAVTQRHSVRVAAMAEALAARLGWPAQARGRLHEAGLVHDVGKIGVPDTILLKPGRLSDEERAIMQEHAALGARIVGDALDEDQVGWVAHHHERWDGGGYPDGRRGDEIPVGARILALADAWDAMTTARDYSSPLPLPAALEECRRCSGSHFWPEAVAALEALHAAGGPAPGEQEPEPAPALV